MDALLKDLINLSSCCFSNEAPAPDLSVSAPGPKVRSPRATAESTTEDDDPHRIAARKFVDGIFVKVYAKRLVSDSITTATNNVLRPVKAESSTGVVTESAPALTTRKENARSGKKSHIPTPKRAPVPRRRKDNVDAAKKPIAQSPTAKGTSKARGKGGRNNRNANMNSTPVKEASDVSRTGKGTPKGKGFRGKGGTPKGRGKGRRPRRASDSSDSPM